MKLLFHWLVLINLVFAGSAEACTIPVFRYALDRWDADKFHLVLPAAAAQDPALQDLLRPLRANGKANMDITTAPDAALTQAELRYSRESKQAVWTGALDSASLATLLDSPARQKIIASILEGDSFIWVIAVSGSPEDEAQAERIEKRLRFLEQVAALPIQDPHDPDSQLGPGPPLRLKFATLRVRLDDPGEAVFLKMLAGPKGEISPEATSFAAPVFGKGRVLGAWPLAQLDDAVLEDASLFLVGRCGCRIKSENPGWDLLLNVDWDESLRAGWRSPGAATVAAEVAAPEVVKTMTEVENTAAVRRGVWWFAGAGALALVAAIGLLQRKLKAPVD